MELIPCKHTNASSSHPCEPPVPAMEQGKRRAVGPVTFVSENEHSLFADGRQDTRRFFLHGHGDPLDPASERPARLPDLRNILGISMDPQVR